MTTPIQDGTVQGSGAVVHQPGRDRQLPSIPTDANGNISPSQLILAALDRGVSIEALDKLAQLQERFEDRQAAKVYADAMAALQEEMPAIKKTKTAKITTTSGGSYSYTYAPLDEIVKVLRPLAKKHGFSWRWNQEETKDGKARTTLRISHVAGHSEENHFTLPTESKSAMSAQQKQAAANTFAKRQTIVDGFGLITTDEDLDAAEPQDPTPITDDQVTVLEDLLRETKTERARFLKWLEVDSLAALPATQYQQAIGALNQKKRGAK